MNANILVLALAALIPMVMGFIWYNPKTMGTAWMQAAGMTEEKMKGANMPLVFGLSYLFSFFLAVGLTALVIHQGHVLSVLMNEPGIHDPNTEMGKFYADFMAKFGTNFRTFKHGVLHGVIGGILIALPIIATNALFERKSFKYVAINVGYWVITIGLMGGVICQFA
jgi:hypothetical protein